MDGNAESLTLHVPERHLDACGRGGQDWPAAEKATAIHALPEVLDATGVLTPDHRRKVADRPHHGLRSARDDALAPAHQASLGLDANEDPPGGDLECLDGPNPHLPALVIKDWLAPASKVRPVPGSGSQLIKQPVSRGRLTCRPVPCLFN